MSAWINGFLGVAFTFFIGKRVLGLSDGQCAWAIAASNIGGLLALIVIIQLEWKPWVKRHVLSRSRRTWPAFLLVYYGSLLLMAPHLANLRVFAWLCVPLALSNGFAILVFGPIQDRLVRRSQRISRKAALSRAAAR